MAAPLVVLGAAADDPAVAELVRRDGQARVFWDATPIDLFFAYDAFHDAAGAGAAPRPVRRHDDPDPRRRAPHRVQGGVQPAEGLGRHRRHARRRDHGRRRRGAPLGRPHRR